MNTLLVPTMLPGRICVTLCVGAALLALAASPVRADLEVHLTFDEAGDPGADSSGQDLHGEIDGAQRVDDAERAGVLEFAGGDDGFVRVRLPEELPGDSFTVAFWVYRDSATAGGGNDGLFQVQIGGDTPSTSTKVIGAWVAASGGVWGRLRQQDGTQLNLDRETLLMESDQWVHLAYRGSGSSFEIVVNGESGVGPALDYDGTLEAHDTVFIGKQGTESWGGRMDDVRIYSQSLSDDEIKQVIEESTVVPSPCPEEGDTHCTGLSVESPAGNVTGVYDFTADAADDSGDSISYSFLAESGGGETKEVGPQTENTARFWLSEGTWTVSVTVDDSASCEDGTDDAICDTQVEVQAADPSALDLQIQLTFDDGNDPGLDSSGNGLDGEVDGAQWVEDADGDRAGVLEFAGANDGFVRVDLLEGLPGDGFTFTFWAYRDAATATAGNDGLIQVQLGGTAPSTSGAAKVVGAWVAGDGGVWGRMHQGDGTQQNLDRATFLMQTDAWTHLAYRGDGENFEVLVNGESGVGPSIPYDGTLGDHDTVFIGKQGAESWGGRLDDFRVYRRALSDEEIAMVVGAPTGPAFLPGDCNADGSVDIGDVICLVDVLFRGFNLLDRSSPGLPCATDDGNLAILDISGDEALDVADIVNLAGFLFAGGPPPPGGASCRPLDAELGCSVSSGCD